MKTIVKRKLTPLVVILVALIVALAGYGIALFTAIQVTTNLTVNEPLSIRSATVQTGTAVGSCTVTSPPPSASCTVSGFAGDSALVTIEVANAAPADITLTVGTGSDKPDVTATEIQFCGGPSGTCTNAVSGIVPATGVVQIVAIFAISQSAAAPGSATLTVQISR